MLFFFIPLETKASYTNDIRCLADAMYFESKGGSEQDMKDVGQVVLNRTDHPKYPKEPCNVVYQRYKTICQFSWACRKHSVKEPEEYSKAKSYAKQLLDSEYRGNRYDTTNGALFFHTKSSNPRWKNVKKCHINKQHIFYRRL